MRIALAAEGTRGDVHPLLTLGDSLVAAGQDVVVCAPPDFRPDAEERGMEFRAVGEDVRAYLGARAEIMSAGGLRVLREAHRWFDASIRVQFQSLPEATAGAEALFGAGIQLAGPAVAELHGIPYRYVTYCPGLLPSAAHAPLMVPWQALPGWVNRLAWLVVLHGYDRPLRRAINRERVGVGLEPIHDAYRYLLTPHPVLAADEILAPVPSDAPFAVTQIPALQPLEGEPLPAKLEDFLDRGEPPVYLGFGSMTDPDPTTTTHTLLDAVTGLGCRALVSEGWAGLGAGPLPEGVLAIGPVSHQRLFPRVAAVVHHGGAGTTATAARAGVPQIIVPHVLDQFYWAGRVARLGLGPPALPRRGLTAVRLAAALASIRNNEIVHERARDVGERLRARAFWARPAMRLLEDLAAAG